MPHASPLMAWYAVSHPLLKPYYGDRRFVSSATKSESPFRMSERNFFAELKRRNVYKVAVAYAVVSWLLIQAASILFPTYEAPAWVMKCSSHCRAWVSDCARDRLGVRDDAGRLKRTEDVSPNETIPQWSRKKFAALIVIVALLAAGLLVFQLVGTPRWAVRSDDNNGGRRSAASLPITENPSRFCRSKT